MTSHLCFDDSKPRRRVLAKIFLCSFVQINGHSPSFVSFDEFAFVCTRQSQVKLYLTLPRICVFHNKPSSSRRHFCRGFHLRRTQISNLPSRNLCYNTCNIINKDLWAMRRTNYIVIANSNGIKHLYLSLTGINLRVCDFKMLKLGLDRNLSFFT